jgi:predicted nucleic acid-binding protein
MLLDTAGLFCYFDRTDARHSHAVELFRSAPLRVVHSYVLAELISLSQSRGLDRSATLSFASDLQDSPLVEMNWVSESMHRSALSLLRSRLDKTYSLCDAISFLLMRERNLAAALTTDHHFEQEGFTALLKR